MCASLDCDDEDEEELGALTYGSSWTPGELIVMSKGTIDEKNLSKFSEVPT